MSSFAIKSAAQWIGNLIAQEVQSLIQVKDNVDELLSELEWMQCFLSDADSKQNKNALIQKWVSEISDLAMESEDLIEMYILEVSYKRRDGFRNSLKWGICCWGDVKTLHILASQINYVTLKIAKLSSRLQTYGVQSSYSLHASETAITKKLLAEQRRTYAHAQPDLIVGLEKDVATLVERLEQGSQKIIVVHGMGGIGKTALAREVYHSCLSKDDTFCRLYLKDPCNGVSYEVARGKTFKGDRCHHGVVDSDHISIKVNVVPKEFETLPLPVPVPAYDLHLLIDAVGSLVQWPIELVCIENEDGQGEKENEYRGSNSHVSRLSTTPIKNHSRELTIVQSVSPDCQWLQTLVGAMAREETFTIYFDANSPLFYYKEEGKTEVFQDDLKLFLEGSELSISIMQIFMRALREDLVSDESGVHIGFLCPAATADNRLKKKTEDAVAYVSNAFLSSTCNGDEFILAPISDSKHWVLLVICPQTFTIYEFDPITLKEGRKLHVKMVINWALKRFKMKGGQIKLKRNEPLWKSVKCPQQSGGGMEHDFFVMRFLYDIVKRCSTSSDLEKVWMSHKEEPYNYGQDELNELQDKWASYFTSRCIT